MTFHKRSRNAKTNVEATFLKRFCTSWAAGKYWSPERPEDYPSSVPRTFPKDPIWPSWGRPNLTSCGPPEMTSRGRPNLMFKWRPWEINSGCPQDVLRTFPREPSEYSSLDVQNFFKLFFHNLFDWANLSKSISTLKVYWEGSETSKMELFLQN